MQVYDYSEARQNFTAMFDSALNEDIIITRNDGNRFKLVSLRANHQPPQSPLDVEGIDAPVTMQELVEIIREGRE